jgi:hypothetical protein
MLLAPSVRRSARRSVLTVTVIIASVLGTATAAAASINTASQAHPAVTATHSVHVLADGSGGPDDTPWG